MEKVLIGNEGFELQKVFSILFTKTAASIANSDWTNFARAFGMEQDYIKKKRKKIQWDMEELNDVCLEILEMWSNSKGESATLELLITNLKEIKWQESIDKLKAYYASVPQVGPKNPPKLDVMQPRNATLESDGALKTNPLENMIIGTKDCSFSKLVVIISKSDTFTSLANDWSDFARWLDIDSTKMNEIRKDLDDRRIRSPDAIEQILQHWRQVESNRATLQRLLDILEQNNKNDIAQSIRSAFLKN